MLLAFVPLDLLVVFFDRLVLLVVLVRGKGFDRADFVFVAAIFYFRFCYNIIFLLLSQSVSSPLFCADRRTGGSAPRRRGGTREGFDRAEEAARARGC